MPKLFVHLRNGEGLQRDERGQEYRSEDAAVQQAARSAGSILGDDLAVGHRDTTIHLMVEREDGSCVATIEVTAKVTRF